MDAWATDLNELSNRERAQLYARMAYTELKRAGRPEDYVPLLEQVAAQEWGTFFGQFGDEKGMYLRVESGGPLALMKIAVGIRHSKPSWRSRLADAWRALRAKDVEYVICLTPENTTKLKDLFRSL